MHLASLRPTLAETARRTTTCGRCTSREQRTRLASGVSSRAPSAFTTKTAAASFPSMGRTTRSGMKNLPYSYISCER